MEPINSGFGNAAKSARVTGRNVQRASPGIYYESFDLRPTIRLSGARIRPGQTHDDGVERLDKELYDTIDYLPVLSQPPIEMRDS